MMAIDQKDYLLLRYGCAGLAFSCTMKRRLKRHLTASKAHDRLIMQLIEMPKYARPLTFEQGLWTFDWTLRSSFIGMEVQS